MAAVRTERRGAQLWITLDRPERLNAWDRALGIELLDAVQAAAVDDGVRAVVVTGAGRAFSSGADLKAGFETLPDGRLDVGGVLRERYHPIILGVRRMPKPVVAAVNGPAVGIGCSLALACDLVLAAESAAFSLAFARIGLVPDGGASALVPARVGFARAAEMALLAEPVPAAQALAWGLANRVVPDAELPAAVDALAAELAAGPTLAYAAAKATLNHRLYRDLEAQLELEAMEQQALAGSRDFAEGVQAFLEKRPPAFRGR